MTKLKKDIKNKTKEYTTNESRMKSTIADFDAKNKELNKQLEILKSLDAKKISEIDESQKFVSQKFDDVAKDLSDVKMKLNKNIYKTNKNNKYSRLDCLELAGVPWQAPENEENCKLIVQEICKELHYWLPDMAISTAHRMSQHPDKKVHLLSL